MIKLPDGTMEWQPFRDVYVFINRNYVQTCFTDGTGAVSTPNPPDFINPDFPGLTTGDYLVDVGYVAAISRVNPQLSVEDAMVLASEIASRHHEIVHSYLALLQNKPYSQVLWDVAHNEISDYQQHVEEEGQVDRLIRGVFNAERNTAHLYNFLRNLDNRVHGKSVWKGRSE